MTFSPCDLSTPSLELVLFSLLCQRGREWSFAFIALYCRAITLYNPVFKLSMQIFVLASTPCSGSGLLNSVLFYSAEWQYL